MNHLAAALTLAGLGVLAWQLGPVAFWAFVALALFAARLKG